MDFVIPMNVGGSVFTYHYLESGAAATASQLSNVSAVVYLPGGSELVSSQAIDPESDGKMAIDINSDNAGSAADYYRARFYFTADSSSHVKDVYFHIAQSPFDLPVHYDDLLRLEPDLCSMSYSGDAKFEQFRVAARDELFYRLKSTGRRPWRLLNIDDLRPCALYLWASYVFRALAKSSVDYFPRADHYRELFERIFARSEFLEDSDADATPDEPSSHMRDTDLRRA